MSRELKHPMGRQQEAERETITDTNEVKQITTEDNKMSKDEWISFFQTKEFPIERLIQSLTKDKWSGYIPTPSTRIAQIENGDIRKKIEEKYYNLALNAAFRYLRSLMSNRQRTSTTWPPSKEELSRMLATTFITERGDSIRDDLERILHSIKAAPTLNTDSSSMPQSEMEVTEIAKEQFNIKEDEDDNIDTAIIEDFYKFQERRYVDSLAAYLEQTQSSFEQRAFLEEERFIDSKTGLLNESGVKRHYTQLAERGAQAIVVYFDVDNFKKINDETSHEQADFALKKIGALLTQHLRARDAGARTGGDEFCIVVEVTPEDTTQALARIQQILEQPIHVSELPNHTISISGGVTVVDPNKTTLEEALERTEVTAFLSKMSEGSGITRDDSESRQSFREIIQAPEGYAAFLEKFVQRKINREKNSARTALEMANKNGNTASIARNTERIAIYESKDYLRDQRRLAQLEIEDAANNSGSSNILKQLFGGVELPTI